MRRDSGFYLKLFWETFSLSAFTFGGGYVIVPLMRKRFVEAHHWLEDEEMLDIVAIAQSSPGVIAVNASVLVGYKLIGVWGAVMTMVATVLPPLITITIVSMFYTALRDNAAVASALRAMQAGVAAIIADAVFKMGATAVKGRGKTALAVAVGCFAASYFFKINAALIILICAVLGAANALRKERAERDLGKE